jgi:hypothetical protein
MLGIGIIVSSSIFLIAYASNASYGTIDASYDINAAGASLVKGLIRYGGSSGHCMTYNSDKSLSLRPCATHDSSQLWHVFEGEAFVNAGAWFDRGKLAVALEPDRYMWAIDDDDRGKAVEGMRVRISEEKYDEKADLINIKRSWLGIKEKVGNGNLVWIQNLKDGDPMCLRATVGENSRGTSSSEWRLKYGLDRYGLPRRTNGELEDTFLMVPCQPNDEKIRFFFEKKYM